MYLILTHILVRNREICYISQSKIPDFDVHRSQKEKVYCMSQLLPCTSKRGYYEIWRVINFPSFDISFYPASHGHLKLPVRRYYLGCLILTHIAVQKGRCVGRRSYCNVRQSRDTLYIIVRNRKYDISQGYCDMRQNKDTLYITVRNRKYDIYQGYYDMHQNKDALKCYEKFFLPFSIKFCLASYIA